MGLEDPGISNTESETPEYLLCESDLKYIDIEIQHTLANSPLPLPHHRFYKLETKIKKF
jgi:hypothetical protein